MSIAVYPGTLDPITNGHLDVINRALNMYEKVILGIAEKSNKELLFSINERVDMAKAAVGDNPKLVVERFNGLVVKFARKLNATSIVRGLRAVSDFEHEFQMAQLNRKLDAKIETVFIMASPEYAYLSSSAVREIASFQGEVSDLVPKKVELNLKSRYSN
ncbi:MAG: pantetheine-phosphate adenylyltransferase [Actinobacteria bacterium]|nr:MAG: pantetheine-phosphate adenylyltransferase [Actinomycetota bacterium]